MYINLFKLETKQARRLVENLKQQNITVTSNLNKNAKMLVLNLHGKVDLFKFTTAINDFNPSAILTTSINQSMDRIISINVL